MGEGASVTPWLIGEISANQESVAQSHGGQKRAHGLSPSIVGKAHQFPPL